MASCPHCGAQMIGAAGQTVKCLGCGSQFQIPAAPPPPPVSPAPSVAPVAPIAKPIAQKRPKRHWAKTAILVSTICWPVFVIGCGSMSYVTAGVGYEPVGRDQYLTPARDTVVDSGALNVIQLMAFVSTAFLVTMLYFLLVFVFFVLWFATKDDQPTSP